MKNSKYKQIEKYTLKEYIDIFDKLKNPSFRKRAWSYHIIKNTLSCVISGEKVAYCSYDQHEYGSKHYNFYSEDGEIFTIDHIIPKSHGGKDVLHNTQLILENINTLKSDKHFFKYDNKYYCSYDKDDVFLLIYPCPIKNVSK